jgi:hypothetical protein
MTSSVWLLNKRTREWMVACASVGASFWADHPAPGCLWAVDDEQQFHVIRVRKRAGTAQHVCTDLMPAIIRINEIGLREIVGASGCTAPGTEVGYADALANSQEEQPLPSLSLEEIN